MPGTSRSGPPLEKPWLGRLRHQGRLDCVLVLFRWCVAEDYCSNLPPTEYQYCGYDGGIVPPPALHRHLKHGAARKGDDSLLKAEFIEDNLKSEADRRECDVSVPSNSSMSFAWNICHPSQLVIPLYVYWTEL